MTLQKTALDATSVSTLQVTSSDTDEFERFSPFQKKYFLVIVSMACFLSPMSTTMFLPAVPVIAKEFNSTQTIITSSNAVYCVVMAISSLLSAPICTIYGRKWPTVICSGLYAVGSILTSQARSTATFYVFRLIMALFGTAFFSIGSMIIRDIFTPEQRGSAMGILLVGTQAGLAIAAVIGGIIVEYSHWRVVFYVLTGLGGAVCLLALVGLQETGRNLKLTEYQKETGKKFKIFPINITRAFKVTTCLPVIMTSIPACAFMYNLFALLTPINYVISKSLGIDSVVLSSLFYLAPGVAFMLGSTFGGRLSDFFVKYYIKKRGKRIPEDRIRSGIFFFAFSCPVSVLLYGWSLEKHWGGVALPVVLMFIAGFSQCMILPCVNAYPLDALPIEMVSSAVANSYVLRFLASGVINGTIIIQIDNIGIGWTCTITAGVIWLGCICSILVILNGEKWRSKLTYDTNK